MKQILILIGVVGVIGTFAACSNNSSSPSTSSPTGTPGVSTITTLQSTDVKVGTGTEATNGRTVSVHYTGWLYSESATDHHGTKFDSSVDRNQPFSFILGVGQVIKGWDQGVLGMKVGGQRTLTIPPSLGYGSAGAAPLIPANATLVFDVELLDVK